MVAARFPIPVYANRLGQGRCGAIALPSDREWRYIAGVADVLAAETLPLADLIERNAELKRELLDFACSPKFSRYLSRLMLDAAGPGGAVDEGLAIATVDHFASQYRLPDGKTVLDKFLAARRDLSTADRGMLSGWRDPVEGFFENLRMDGDAAVLLNLVDDLEYRVYSNIGPAILRRLPKGGFVFTKIVPVHPAVPGAWLVSGMMQSFRKSDGPHVARIALEIATEQPQLVFRNPEKITQGWEMMRAQRTAFVEFFGTDELVLPPAEARTRISAYYRHYQDSLPAKPRGRAKDADVGLFDLHLDEAEADTLGIIFDETDGLNFYLDYGMLRELFADPDLASDKRYADVLRGYLNSDTVAPLPLHRVAAAYPRAVDAVYQKVLRKPSFTWADHGEALLRRRKPWYYEREPRPSISVIGNRLAELATRR
jgi:hypothetical protein